MVPAETSSRCPKCAALLPLHAPAGICPKCLLEAGLLDAPGYSEPAGTTPAPGFTPPTLEEIAPCFPQLEVLGLLGRGGMGAVYKARQKDLDRLVALKILPLEVGAEPAFAERFFREARALAKLSHPNIVTVYDFGETDGLYYFMMEYVEGTNLRHLLSTSRLQPPEALAIIPPICAALQFAHNAGVIHRDIKPENILVSKRGEVKIADFGLVKLLGAAAADYSLTGTQQVMGTVHYMAPEQVQHTHAVDHRADIYSLGVVFYEMLTGQLPIGRFDPPSKKVTLDARLDDIVLRSLEADPLRRYQHASDVSADIESLAHAKPPRLVPETPQPIPSKPKLTSGVSSRYSIKAILGAAWAPLFFIAILLSLVSVSAPRSLPATTATSETVVVRSTDNGMKAASSSVAPMPHNVEAVTETRFAPDWWQWALLLTVFLPGIAAPFGTTILGIVAISDIRHSQGRLLGLPLAIFDALFYPLLLLDGIAVVVVGITCRLVVSLAHSFGDWTGSPTWFLSVFIMLLLAVPLCFLLDFFIVRAVWKRCKIPAFE